MSKTIVVPEEYASQIRKLFPDETTKGLVKVLEKGIGRVQTERRFAKKHAGKKTAKKGS